MGKSVMSVIALFFSAVLLEGCGLVNLDGQSMIAAKAEGQDMSVSPFGNPLIPDLLADPSIVEFDGTFYCYATTDGAGAGLATAGLPVVWKSEDFLNWHFEGSIFADNFDAKFWAPSSLIEKNGRYYLYPTLDGKISVVTADAPEGPFRTVDGKDINKESGWQPFGIEQDSSIDAEVFVDDDGRAYMFWSRHRVIKLKPDLVTPDGGQMTIPVKRGGYSEGPYLFKRKGIYYYMYTLEGHENYKYAYMMSRTSPLGPWEAPERDIVAATDYRKKIYGPGHGCFFKPRDSEQWYFVHLEFGRGGTNRQIWAQKMNFNDDGTIEPIELTAEGVGVLRQVGDNAPDLAAGKTALSSSVRPGFRVEPRAYPELDRVENYAPANALDGSNGSRWLAAEDDKAAWYQLDLGRARDIRRTELYFVNPTAGHVYVLEHSLDAKTWNPYGGCDKPAIRSPHTDKKFVRARYLKLTILSGAAGLWQFRVY